MPVEVGSWGFTSNSLNKAYGTLGVTGAKTRSATSNNAEAAEKGRVMGAGECHLDAVSPR